MMTCEKGCDIAVSFEITDVNDGVLMADLSLSCVRCGQQFAWKGLPSGVDFDRPSTSPDLLELRAPIFPLRG